MPAENVQNFIAGKWCDPIKPGETFLRKDPANGEEVSKHSQAGKADIDAAVAAAKKAFAGWRSTPQPKRAEVIYRSAEIARKRKEEIAQLMTREMGKPIAEARGDVQEAIDMGYYIASEGRRAWGLQIPSELPNKRMYTMRQPLGVCGLITPWNFPIAIPTWKTYPALLMGNTVVFKPASETSLLGKRFTELLIEAGVPSGVFNLVVGAGSTCGNALVEHPDVRMISFTGSTTTGLGIAAKAAPLNKRVSLEMGGKNPVVVMDDADLELACNAILWAAYGTTGQRCTACSRAIIHAAVYDKLLKMLVEGAKKLHVGHGSDPKSFLGAVVNEKQLKSIHGYVEIGVKEGAKLECGGAPLTQGEYAKGHFYPPTILSGVTPKMRVAVEEIFGPVLSVIKAKDYDDAIAIANNVEFGLSGSFFSRDVNLCHRASEEMEVGLCYINAGTTGAEVSTPFGGWKNTGNGHREGGPTVIDAFSEIKTVITDYSGKVQKAQIDNN
ncbi:MAG: aldehyde dehydrogenase family protein [Planctomycetes bacterium]|nr:aldehyde dehydrogenase family protein [Planctomycetota bacterium]